MWRLVPTTFVSCALVAGLSYPYVRASSEPSFITAPVKRGVISSTVKATGTVDPVIMVEVSSQLSGRIARVLVNFNDHVKAGQPIAQLDPEIFAARVNEAKAVLRVAKANAQLQKAALQRAKVALDNAHTARKVEEAQLTAAQAKQDETERDFQRNHKLASTGSVSDRDLTQSRAQRDAGAAGLRALEEQIKMKAEAIAMAEAELSMAEANLQNAEAVVEQRQAALEQAELDLERTSIRAPIDGVVIKRDVNPGQTVAVSLEAKTLFKIANDLTEMEVHGKIDEADVGRLRVGQTAQFTVDAYPDQTFTGKVLQIRKAPEVVQNVVTYTAIISAPNPDLLLLPGMTAVLRIVVSDTGEVLKVPNQALRFRPRAGSAPEPVPSSARSAVGASGTVWVVGKEGKPTPVAVKLGANDDKNTQLLAGPLSEGQELILGAADSQSRSGFFGIRLGF
jgi:HlyD family secretion protein